VRKKTACIQLKISGVKGIGSASFLLSTVLLQMFAASNFADALFWTLKVLHIYTIGDGPASVGDGDSELVMYVSARRAMASIPVSGRHLISRGSWDLLPAGD
jgi:hypothetical protein